MSLVEVILEDDVRIPATVCDLASFRAWVHSKEFPQRGRFAFIAGRLEVDMNAERIQSHNKVKVALSADLVNFVRSHDLGEVLADRALVVNERAVLCNEPDLTYCSWESLESGTVRYEPKGKQTDELEVVGSPDLVVEIVSDSSVKKVKVRLRKIYFAAGIVEYWLVDARDETVDFQILTRSRRAFTSVPADRTGYRKSPLFGVSFFLERKSNRVGGASYRLQHR
jgi:Uma2 family endonuclease